MKKSLFALIDWINSGSFDRFFLAATPKFFEWLRWIVTLAAIGYVAQKTHSFWAWVVYLIANVCLAGYFVAFVFSRVREQDDSMKGRLLLNLAMMSSACSGLALQFIAWKAIDAIIAAQK